MAVSLTFHIDFQIEVPFGRVQKQTDENHTDFIIIEDVDATGIVQRTTTFLNSPLFLKIMKNGLYGQVSQLPFTASLIAVHNNLDNLKVYIQDSQTLIESLIGLTPTSVAEYAFGFDDDELYLKIDFVNNTITAYA